MNQDEHETTFTYFLVSLKKKIKSLIDLFKLFFTETIVKNILENLNIKEEAMLSML